MTALIAGVSSVYTRPKELLSLNQRTRDSTRSTSATTQMLLFSWSTPLPLTILLIINSMLALCVTTLRDLQKKQIEHATAARRLMGMIASPSERDFQGLVRLNLLKDCPITNNDITNAHIIFGPDLANIRGKTVRKKPDHVRTDYVEIPQILFDVHSRVTLLADIMFVNGVGLTQHKPHHH
jgi:hypothetical protein